MAIPTHFRNERVTIIYPDPQRGREIKGWLKPYSSLVQIDAYQSLRVAVPMLDGFPSGLLLVADRFPEASGTSLYQGLRVLCPKAQVVMLAHERTPIEAILVAQKQEPGLHYFTQPWDRPGLLNQVEASLGVERPVYTVAFILNEVQQQEINRHLEELQGTLSTRSISLITDTGQVLACKGDAEFSQIGEISSLLASSFAALQEVGHTLGDFTPANNLIHRQSETEHIYVIGVGDHALLVLLFSDNASAPRMGTVAYYANREAQALAGILASEDSGQAAKMEPVTAVAKSNGNKRLAMSFTRAFKEGYVTMGLIDRFELAHGSPGLKNRPEESEWLDLENQFSVTPEQQQAIEKIVAHLKGLPLDAGGNRNSPSI